MAWFREVSGNAIQSSVCEAVEVGRPVLSGRMELSLRSLSSRLIDQDSFDCGTDECRSDFRSPLRWHSSQAGFPHASKVVTSSRKHISYPGKQEFQQRYGMEPLGFCFG